MNHLVLVPGFGGFDVLGSLQYYHGVTEVLASSSLALHYFPNLPTASVRTRAVELRHWLEERWRRKLMGPEDTLHLVGHSTGGLDVRQLLNDFRQRQLERSATDAEDEVLARLQSVQFLSTPQRGTGLAYRLNRPAPRFLLTRPALRLAYESARGLRERGLSLSSSLLRLLLRRPAAQQEHNWIDALLDTLERCYSREGDWEGARARADYFELLRWLLHMASDSSALGDLSPVPILGAPPSPAHLTDPAEERDFLLSRGIRFSSIVTVARPSSGRTWDLFNRLHALTASAPHERLGGPQEVRLLHAPEQTLPLEPRDNDGLVNSVSMVWPDAESCWAVEADHADVIGHFEYESPDEGRGLRRYDLLTSHSGFDAEQFRSLWRKIGGFAEGRPYPSESDGRARPTGTLVH
jgi:hypothetical protein